MTIVVGVGTPEGLVLASDSRTTTMFGDNERHRIASDYAQKIFEVEKMGIASFGMAFLDRDTIAGVMDQFAAQISSDQQKDVAALAQALGGFFDERFADLGSEDDDPWDADTDGYPLGFLVAGYDEKGVGYIEEVLIPGGEISEFKASTTEAGMMWRGQTDVIGRLIKGVDWPCLAELDATVSDELVKDFEKLEYSVPGPITLQDGIDFVSFVVRTTIDMQRFSDGTVGAPGSVPGCGGEIQILAVERSKSTWVRPLTLASPSRPGLAEGATS